MVTETNPGGVVVSQDGTRTDYLFRLSLKALIVDEQNRVLMVREKGRDYWDLPGGGMDHGESIRDCLARELAEEVNLRGNFTFRAVDIDDPGFLQNSRVYQIHVTLRLWPEVMEFSPGTDGEEVKFMTIEEANTALPEASIGEILKRNGELR